MKKKIILGINWEQNSTAALMVDGAIVSCSSEERFTRIKNDERYPKKFEQIYNNCCLKFLFISSN